MSLERLHKSFDVNKMGLLPLRNIVVDVSVLLLTVQLKVLSTNVGSCSASKFPNQSFEVNSTFLRRNRLPTIQLLRETPRVFNALSS
jgi:hypothetical protein